MTTQQLEDFKRELLDHVAVGEYSLVFSKIKKNERVLFNRTLLSHLENQLIFEITFPLTEQIRIFIGTLRLKSTRASSSRLVEEVPSIQGEDVKMIFVDGGTFEPARGLNQNVPVDIPDFYLAEAPVTQGLYQAVTQQNPSKFATQAECPVENIGWELAHIFIELLNKLTQQRYRLPNELEWEFAARDGKLNSQDIFPGEGDIDKVAWYKGNAQGKTHPVKRKFHNKLGFHDMSGNVWEWCYAADVWGKDPQALQKNYAAWANWEYSCLRGGSWKNNAKNCKIYHRNLKFTKRKMGHYGLRLAHNA